MALDGNILVSEIHEILARDWTVKIRCVRRVASAVADRLAALSKGKPKLPLNLLRHYARKRRNVTLPYLPQGSLSKGHYPSKPPSGRLC
ncbi:hypothetical protein V6N12_012643 [Hibiscus sabdariffa]|uniref:Uncharacterized protein n=1 Tax=Hibiscus sabdariffa TaxID=183260 RepID=A0ABR2DE34_9ROSI